MPIYDTPCQRARVQVGQAVQPARRRPRAPRGDLQGGGGPGPHARRGGPALPRGGDGGGHPGVGRARRPRAHG
eukprot:7327223-Alexandrium_andersonii.AAC.1